MFSSTILVECVYRATENLPSFSYFNCNIVFSETYLANYRLRKTDAIQFLSLTDRLKTTRRTVSVTNPVEECCHEKCILEEVHEYC